MQAGLFRIYLQSNLQAILVMKLTNLSSHT